MGNQWTALQKLHEGFQKDESRARPRFVARDGNCERGRLEDFSTSGVRIRYTRRPKFAVGDVVALELFSSLGQHNCSVQAVRITKKGFRNYEVGFQFTDPESAKQMQLFRLGYDPLADNEWSAY